MGSLLRRGEPGGAAPGCTGRVPAEQLAGPSLVHARDALERTDRRQRGVAAARPRHPDPASATAPPTVQGLLPVADGRAAAATGAGGLRLPVGRRAAAAPGGECATGAPIAGADPEPVSPLA